MGIGATAIMDLWLILLKKLNIPTLNFALLGRWIGHVIKGQWFHPAISKTAPIKRELALGWWTHYAIGISFSILLILITGTAWLYSPTLLTCPVSLTNHCYGSASSPSTGDRCRHSI